ncbi:branched-chain amino acid ABC transporter substrate-binding protein [Rhizobium rhizosphaerae]|uniref:Branched-chain amino acid ABC transporter substrate-binding protein n=1 Tax=Xaviernesmea rhizosphaerae TaxID=1672749 RepID=A0ABX3PJ71_9HYPH|nr:branched-chain amino acid ABC transporter substrate-binding protein [Xaviernesmea rhizosphaerae]OQP88451.1 branched-chain amino acid ABC transporter substrate-binding protein [Xaviernesmea rhizosphaerae]
MLKPFLGLFLAAGLLPLAHAEQAAAAGLRLAVVAPTQGPFAQLGRQIIDGAKFEAEKRGSTIIVVPERCEEGNDDALRAGLAAAKPEAALGFLCTESLVSALPDLAKTGIPAITVSVRSDILMEDALKNQWPLFRFAPSGRTEGEAAAQAILSRWRDQPLGLIDDGTIHGRELVAAVRAKLEQIGVTATFTDTFRPGQEQQIALVRRLGRSGASHVFVGGDRSDIAIIARDAASEKIPLTLMGGEALQAADAGVALADGTLAIGLPDPAERADAAPVVGAMRAAGLQPDGYVLPAYAAATLLETAKDRAASEGIPLAQALVRDPFPTVLGPVHFTEGHELARSRYRLLEWRGNRFQLASPAAD